MSGVDRLNGGTDTPTMSQRPESGEVILDGKEGRGMWVWSVLAVLSSRMSAGGFSLGIEGYIQGYRVLVVNPPRHPFFTSTFKRVFTDELFKATQLVLRICQ